MPQSRGPWDKLQLVSGGIRKGSGQAESLSHPGALTIAPETEALPGGARLTCKLRGSMVGFLLLPHGYAADWPGQVD
jgi:hypothetical protein